MSAPPRVILATLLVACGGIHLAMVPPHATASNTEGIAFAITASVQLLLGLLVAQRVSWLLLTTIVVVQVAAIVAWMVSRTAGLPLGAHAGQPEPVTRVDLTCVILEVVSLAVVALIALYPRLRGSWPAPTLPVARLVPVGVLVFSTAALSAPGALQHGHSDAAGDGSVAHVHADNMVSGTAAPAPATDPLPPASEPPLDEPGERRLEAQLDRVRVATARYPTVADAKRAGMYDASSTESASPAYFVAPFNLRSTATPGLDLDHPLVYLYAGPSDVAPVVGVVYFEFTAQGPTGFVGPTDRWKALTGLCSVPLPGGSSNLAAMDVDLTPNTCNELAGTYAPSVRWMLHVWTAPGWENPLGVFAETNPRLECIVGAYREWIDSTIAASRGSARDADADREWLQARLATC